MKMIHKVKGFLWWFETLTPLSYLFFVQRNDRSLLALLWYQLAYLQAIDKLSLTGSQLEPKKLLPLLTPYELTTIWNMAYCYSKSYP